MGGMNTSKLGLGSLLAFSSLWAACVVSPSALLQLPGLEATTSEASAEERVGDPVAAELFDPQYSGDSEQMLERAAAIVGEMEAGNPPDAFSSESQLYRVRIQLRGMRRTPHEAQAVALYRRALARATDRPPNAGPRREEESR